MKKILPIIVVLMLVLTPSVLAIRYTPSCIDTNTVLWDGTVNRTVNGNLTVFQYSYTESCEYGCVNDSVTSQCAPAPFNVSLNIIIPLLIGILVVFWWLVKK